MQYRTIPKTGDRLSVLGFGAMRFPTRMGLIREKRTEQLICEAVDGGVNYIDTAYPYHQGRSEPLLGKILARTGRRDQVKLATKLPHWFTRNTDEMEKILDSQLKRLRTDVIDYYLVHNINGSTWDIAKSRGVIEFLTRALAQGKIKNAGFSFHGEARDFAPIVDDFDWTFCQIQYNFLDTGHQAGTQGLEYAAARDLGVIVMEPLRGGNLAKTPPPEVARVWNQSSEKRSPVAWALGWIWNHPAVTTVLSGMNQMDQIHENLTIAEAALAGHFSHRELDTVDQAVAAFRRVMKVECTGCQYCLPCPAGVDISRCFDLYNAKHAWRDKSATLFYLGLLGGFQNGKPALASMCKDCGACLEKCPQSIDIPEKLRETAADMEGWWTKPALDLARKIMVLRNGRFSGSKS
ncbi:MAG: aldo/keto reductase [Desulfobacterales bacterium]|nr:aldo/keto reductase [Desulfobacterales bacterium]